jgi:hypothetical protein
MIPKSELGAIISGEPIETSQRAKAVSEMVQWMQEAGISVNGRAQDLGRLVDNLDYAYMQADQMYQTTENQHIWRLRITHHDLFLIISDSSLRSDRPKMRARVFFSISAHDDSKWLLKGDLLDMDSIRIGSDNLRMYNGQGDCISLSHLGRKIIVKDRGIQASQAALA